MKKLFPVYLILLIVLSFCKKGDQSSQFVTTSSCNKDSVTSVFPVFSAHIDTFSGLLDTKVEDDALAESTKVSVFFVNHVSVDSVIVSGSMLAALTYSEDGAATYGLEAVAFNFTVDSSGNGNYYFVPLRHAYNRVILHGDSLYVTLYSQPDCFTLYQQTFAGRKNP